MSIEIKGNEIFRDGVKVGYYSDPDNHLRMTRGNGEHREEIEAFLREQQLSASDHGAQGDPEDGVFVDEAGRGAGEESDFVPHETDRSAEIDVPNAPIICGESQQTPRAVKENLVYRPPIGTPEEGDKSPEVIAWHFARDPEAAKKKYARSKNLWPE